MQLNATNGATPILLFEIEFLSGMTVLAAIQDSNSYISFDTVKHLT